MTKITITNDPDINVERVLNITCNGYTIVYSVDLIAANGTIKPGEVKTLTMNNFPGQTDATLTAAQLAAKPAAQAALVEGIEALFGVYHNTVYAGV